MGSFRLTGWSIPDHLRRMGATPGVVLGVVMSHAGAGGSSVGTRLSGTGYRWSAVGENVAMGQASPAAVVAAWLASPRHCANIMNTAFVDVGFGFAPRADGAPTYATLVLARPR